MSELPPLQSIMRLHGVTPSTLARRTGYSRQLLLRLRTGRMLPSTRCAAVVVSALWDITRQALTLQMVFGAAVVQTLGGDAWVALVALHVFAERGGPPIDRGSDRSFFLRN